MDPLTVMLGLGLLNAGAQYVGGAKQERAAHRQEKTNKDDARRAAIERAMGGTTFSRNPTQVKAPDLTNYGLVSGLSNLGSNIVAQKYL